MDRAGSAATSEFAGSAAARVDSAPEPIWTIRDLEGRPYGRTHLTSLIKAGKLKAKRDGRYCLIRDQDWQAYLNSLPSAAEVSS